MNANKMLEPWNNALLEPPPVNTFLREDITIDSNDLTGIVQDVIFILSNQSPLHQEGAILSRLIYKFDKKFRNDIGYRNLKKVNTALKRYLKINLAKDFENFADVIPAPESDDDYLPTRQMLEYVLVRIQSFSKIMVRICVCSKKSGIFYWDRVTRGESHWMSLMPYSVMCRIWSLTSVLLRQSCNWYTRLYQYLDKLQLVGLPFLPNDYTLPADIEQWLDLQHIDEHGAFVWSKNKCIEVISSLEEEDNEEEIDIFQYMQNVNDISEEKPKIEPSPSEETNLIGEKTNAQVEFPVNIIYVNSRKRKNNDLGQAISRENFKKTFGKTDETLEKVVLKISSNKEKKHVIIKNKQKVDTSSTQIHSTDTITSQKDIKLFIAKEERLRNNGNKQSLSNHLSFMQWQALKLAINNLYEAGLADQKLVKKFKKIWTNKCIAYL